MAGMKSIVDRRKRAGILSKSSDRHCSFLPMDYLYERVVLLVIPTHWYQVICCATPGILFEYYASVKPTRIFMVPRILNKAYDKIVGEVEKS
jgi:long-subunit acyl-CoA synthetase (AMP-forming)